MKICVWRTGHEIADRVAEAVASGLNVKYQTFHTRELRDCHNIHEVMASFDIPSRRAAGQSRIGSGGKRLG